MITYLTRSARFSAAHRYFRPEWSEEENRQRFGACANEHGHGHNYLLEVTVAGAPDVDTGFCVDLGALDSLISEGVTSILDHQHLNHAVLEFQPGGKVPTTENLAIWIWERLEGRLAPARLIRVRLREDDSLWVDVVGGTDGKGSDRDRSTLI